MQLLSRLIALVEGHTEATFFEIAHSNARAVRCIPNGKSVPLATIVEEIIDQLELFGGEDVDFFVVFDREGRKESAQEIVKFILDGIEAAGVMRSVVVGVPDREIENWILAETEKMSSMLGADYRYPGESTFGKVHFERLLVDEFHSPTSKAKLLKSCVASNILSESVSFKDFHDLYTGDWHWMVR